MTRRIHLFLGTALLAVFSLSSAIADQHTAGVPALSSRPGAEFTIYLNVAGFNYDGMWGAEAKTPGTTPALNDRLPTDTFNATEVAQIEALWSRSAQSYIGFNVNVTTIDPAVAAGQDATDALRQAYYDATPNLMHTVVGSQLRDPGHPDLTPGGKWYSDDADGVSGLAVVTGVTGSSGDHTNWMFSEAQAGAATGGVINGDYIGAISAHENAHAFGLYHQGDWTGSAGDPDSTAKVNEYSLGDANPGNGTYVPIIGQASDRQRVTWRFGDTGGEFDVQTLVNDVQSMLAIDNSSNGRPGAADLHLIDDGIGHTLGTATPLPLVGNQIDVLASSSKGVIVPLSESNPNPLGSANYTTDWFSFYSDGGDAISLTVNNSTDFLTKGVADGVGTLRSKLTIYDALGTVVDTGIEDVSTLLVSYSNLLGAGTYFAQIESFGGHQQIAPQFNPASYFDMGAFFLTGSGFDVIPEPSSFVLLAFAVGFFYNRRGSR